MFPFPPYAFGNPAAMGAAGYDADAAAYFAAASITDTTQKSAWNQAVIDLKAASLWTKLVRVYPLMGGDATKHSFCAKSLTQITWSGTVTHNANGITGDGSTGYGDTGLAGTSTTANDVAFGIYSRTNIAENSRDIASSNGIGNNTCLGIWTEYSDNNSYFDNDVTARITVATGTSLGLILDSRTASNDHRAFRNGSQIGSTSTVAQGSRSANNFLLLSEQGGAFSSRNLALAFVSAGLTPTNVANLYTAIQTFQTTLGRNV